MTTNTPGVASKVPSLPPNVTIFAPKRPKAAQNLLQASRFTRLSASASSTSPERLAQVLSSHASVDETFCFAHGRAVLIFDAGEDPAALEDAHHEHFRAVCLALRDADIGLDVAKCVHDAETVLQAGFQIDSMESGSVLVIDLMQAEDDEDDDSSSEEENDDRNEEAKA